ncbi:hypothetical protein [Nocardia cyriacigeorgica]|jgi:hypothetical protein|uniref:hypothetical protein n=1 Tax=Nocardia cyriacigeorgica TaxID=135487 RepID=UPI00030AEC3B|nr:hypothetical protein [Nocardia cyriacigeorgica]AVH23543.1 hypothetical protein C5B73_21055 [Nocardia cyriacigeorgica]MBF6323134.1 hypothetical protein [Nocardia cyriacigeorgica]MBF6414085.1 hypothetical protein [Nocardia cyriacigeorgica]MBF6496638.1 hypothetical protein [Nocardia cyriacigeorgica]PPJ15572.1 hypothetical protein C5E43_05220 [Nocardia cyriacigeorgica]
MSVRDELRYRIEISEPGRLEQSWWRIENTGTPAQVCAALTELAARLCRDLLDSTVGTRVHRLCWYGYRVEGADGMVLAHAEDMVRACELPSVFWTVAATVGDSRATPRPS